MQFQQRVATAFTHSSPRILRHLKLRQASFTTHRTSRSTFTTSTPRSLENGPRTTSPASINCSEPQNTRPKLITDTGGDLERQAEIATAALLRVTTETPHVKIYKDAIQVWKTLVNCNKADYRKDAEAMEIIKTMESWDISEPFKALLTNAIRYNLTRREPYDVATMDTTISEMFAFNICLSYVDDCYANGKPENAKPTRNFLLHKKKFLSPSSFTRLVDRRMAEGSKDPVQQVIRLLLSETSLPYPLSTYLPSIAASIHTIATPSLQLLDNLSQLLAHEPNSVLDDYVTEQARKLLLNSTSSDPQVMHTIALLANDEQQIATFTEKLMASQKAGPIVTHMLYKRAANALEKAEAWAALEWWNDNAVRRCALRIDHPDEIFLFDPKNHPGLSDVFQPIEASLLKRLTDQQLVQEFSKIAKTKSIDYNSVKYVFERLGKAKKLNLAREMAQRMLQLSSKADSPSSAIKLRTDARAGAVLACIYADEFLIAREIMNSMISENLIPYADMYAQYLIQSKDWNRELAYEFFQESVRMGVKPTNFFSTTLIHHLSSDWNRVEEVMQYSKLHNVSPTTGVYLSAITAALRCYKEQTAVALFHELQATQKRIDDKPFTYLGNFYATVYRNREAVISTFNSMPSNLRTADSYIPLLQAYATLSPIRMDKAAEVIETMQRDKLAITGKHIAKLVIGYGVHLGDVAEAHRQLDRLTKMMHANFAWQAMALVYIFHHNMSRLLKLRKRRNELLPVSAYFENVVLIGCGALEEKRLDVAEKIFETLSPIGESRKGLVAQESERTMNSYLLLVGLYVQAGQLETARKLLNSQTFPRNIADTMEELLQKDRPAIDRWFRARMLSSLKR